MKARPILFSGPMVRALLAGTKTQTRRVVKPQPYGNGFIGSSGEVLTDNDYLPPDAMLLRVGKGRNSYVTSSYEGWESECPYGEPGDLLWVRETTNVKHASETCVACDNSDIAGLGAKHTCRSLSYRADGEPGSIYWTPGIHMPRWASRLTLRITDVRVQRLQDISEEDALAEGVEATSVIVGVAYEAGGHVEKWANRYLRGTWPCDAFESPSEAYGDLWKHINGPDSWAANPWVWAITFEVIRANVDTVMASKEPA